MAGGNFKRSTAEIISELLDERVRKGLDYVRSEEFRAERDRIRQGAADRLKNVRERYRPKRRTPEAAARERELTLRLAEVEAEAAELRIRLSELLEQEESCAPPRGSIELQHPSTAPQTTLFQKPCMTLVCYCLLLL